MIGLGVADFGRMGGVGLKSLLDLKAFKLTFVTSHTVKQKGCVVGGKRDGTC